jgi:hypothetical protein
MVGLILPTRGGGQTVREGVGRRSRGELDRRAGSGRRRWRPSARPRGDRRLREQKGEFNFGSTQAPYLNSLANSGAKFTNSFAIEQPSEPNYRAQEPGR